MTGFLFDLNACTGCRACELACAIENDLPWDRSWRRVSTFNPQRASGAPVFHLSLACNHCSAAPCIEQCPALAIRRDAVGGAVLIDDASCIGCRYCSWACPYDAPVYDAAAGVMTKCTFCDHRQKIGREPACVAGCPTGALSCGALDELPACDHVDGFPARDHGAAIRFVPLRRERDGPERSLAPARRSGSIPVVAPASKIQLRSEWPLLAFSLLALGLVTWFTASVAGGVGLPAIAFMVLAAAAAGLSTLHLGRKRRAWRALLNVRRSWLSREIATYSAFAVLGALHLLYPEPAVLGWSAMAVGLTALFCIDRVYDVAERQGFAAVHSADVTVLWITLASAALAPAWLVAVTSALALLLYGWRKLSALRRGAVVRGACTLLRLASLLGPIVLSVLQPQGWRGWAIVSLGAGAVVDRIEFYLELEVPSPRRQIAALAESFRSR